MATQLASKPGLTGAAALSIPKDWDPAWFRGFINNLLKGADVRNARGVGGISVTGNIASPYASIGFAAPVVLNPTTGQVTLTVNGAANQNTALFQGSVTSGQSFGLDIRAGTTSADRALIVRNAAATATFMEIFGDGSGFLGYNGTANTINWTAAGNVTVPTPASGIAVTLNGNGGNAAISMLGAAGNSAFLSFGANAASANVFIGAVGAAGLLLTGSVAGDLALRSQTGNILFGAGGSTTQVKLTTAGNVTIAAPSSGSAFAVTGFAGSAAVTITPGLNSVALQLTGSAVGQGTLVCNTMATTGAQTATFTATNKPGSGTTGPDKWLPVSLDGTLHYIPCFL